MNELITATVNPPAFPEVKVSFLAALARELAMNIKPKEMILSAYKLSTEQFDTHIAKNPFFIRAFEASCIEWNSALSTNQRIKAQAGAVLEESLPELGARMLNGREKLQEVVETAKLFSKLAGAEITAATNSPSEKFTINIQIGSQKVTVENTTPAIDITPTKDTPI